MLSVISELASIARGCGPAGGLRSVPVSDLRAGMMIALPFREFRLPWQVLAEPVPVSLETSMVMLQRVRPPSTVGVPVGVRFLQAALVERLPRHYGVCSRCGGLSPCVDEWVEAALIDLDGLSVATRALTAPEEVTE